MTAPRKYPLELRERAVRLNFESGGRPIAQVARDLGIHREALRQWVPGGGGRDAAYLGAAPSNVQVRGRTGLPRARRAYEHVLHAQIGSPPAASS